MAARQQSAEAGRLLFVSVLSGEPTLPTRPKDNKSSRSAATLRVTVGNTCEPIDGADGKYRWTVYVGPTSDAGVEDPAMSAVESVAFVLHKSFKRQLRHVTRPAGASTPPHFALGPIVGYGEFEVRMRLIFTDKRRAPVVVRHMLSFDAGGVSRGVEIPLPPVAPEAEEGVGAEDDEGEQDMAPWWEGMDEDAALAAFRQMHPCSAFKEYYSTSSEGHPSSHGDQSRLSSSTTILHHAARVNWHRMVVQAIGHGMSVDTTVTSSSETRHMKSKLIGSASRRHTTSTALHVAAKAGSLQAIVRLVEYGANVSLGEVTEERTQTFGMRNKSDVRKFSRSALALAPDEVEEQLRKILATGSSR